MADLTPLNLAHLLENFLSLLVLYVPNTAKKRDHRNNNDVTLSGNTSNYMFLLFTSCIIAVSVLASLWHL